MDIIVGSTSPHKLTAVREACKRLGVELTVGGMKTSSGQNEQPVGYKEMFAGAITRAEQALQPDTQCIAIGIESGLVTCRENGTFSFLDVAAVVVMTSDGRLATATSAGFAFPVEYVMEARAQGFEKTTVGSIITKHLGGDPTDPHSVLTDGKITRTETLVVALIAALKQIL